MKLLDIFSGTKSISKVFEKHGHETFTIDIVPEFNADIQDDILDITSEMILERFGRPDVIWASPPCTKFSVAAIGRNWIDNKDGTYTAKNEGAEEAKKIVLHTIKLIKELNPTYFFIENPRGMLRKMPFMQEFERFTVTYCQYGDTRMKPTDIWTNFSDIDFKPPCKNGDPCHEAAPRGSRTGTQGLKNAMLRAVVPEGLCEHVYQKCNEKISNIKINNEFYDYFCSNCYYQNKEDFWECPNCGEQNILQVKVNDLTKTYEFTDETVDQTVRLEVSKGLNTYKQIK